MHLSADKIPINYPAKLLLFGEYAVLMGMQALAVPFTQFSGKFEYSESKQSKYDLSRFIEYLEKIEKKLTNKIDTERLSNDIAKGLYFESGIPWNSGLGSSGALVAAIYQEYTLSNISWHEEFELPEIKNDLGLMESCFHGKSSGFDPLVALIQKPLLIDSENNIKILPAIEYTNLPGIKFFLIKSKKSGKTGGLVGDFLSRLKEEDFAERFRAAYYKYSNHAIKYLLSRDKEKLFESFSKLSEFQFNQMSSLIPEDISKYFSLGLSSGNFSLKICGSGGGGYFLGITRDIQSLPEQLKKGIVLI
ncbi:MAG: hypothetical protein JXA77_10730 [Bacteroidales bacterium]|nr:hypothetical protein [Bacteroidales bacterium]MBN2818514.1 hypothetical protein [Bacteroidales bacterium]